MYGHPTLRRIHALIRSRSTHLNTYGQIVFLNCLVIQGMIDFNVGPCIAIILPLLKVKRVIFVGLRGGAWHQPIKHRRIAFDSRAGCDGA